MSQLTGGKMLAQLNRKNPNLGALLAKMIAAHNHVAAQAGIDPVGQAAAPPPPQSVDVIVTGEQANIRVVDNNPTNRARTYFSEVHTDAQFSSPKMVVQHGATRDAQVVLPTFDATGTMQAYHVRVYAQTPGSPPSPAVAYPTYVTMAGTTEGDLPASAGSGTSPSSGTVSAQGFGSFPTRNATKPGSAVYAGGGGGGGGVGGVTQIVAGSNITISPSGGTGVVTVNSTGGGFANPMTTQGDLIVGGASGAAQRLAAGIAGQVLTSGGPGVLPSYQPGASGGVASLNSLTGAIAITGDSSITVTPSGSSIALHATGGGGGGGGLLMLFPTLFGGPVPTIASTGLSTAYNQSASFTATNGSQGVILADPNSHGGSFPEGVVKAYPATPFTLTTVFSIPLGMTVNNVALVIASSLTGKLIAFAVQPSAGGICVFTFNTPASFNSTLATKSLGGCPILGFKIADDGTNLTLSASADGDYWPSVYTVAKSASWLGASGFNYLGASVAASNTGISSTLLYWNGA